MCHLLNSSLANIFFKTRKTLGDSHIKMTGKLLLSCRAFRVQIAVSSFLPKKVWLKVERKENSKCKSKLMPSNCIGVWSLLIF